MKPLEILLVTRRFWPHSGLTELALANLARDLQQAGHRITVATVCWSREWSRIITFHGMPVVRFTRPFSGPWGSFRIARALTRQFAINTFDGIVVSGLGDESLAITRIARHQTPVLIRVDSGLEGVTGRLHRKHVELCQAADAVVANSPGVAAELARLEQMPPIHVVPDGIPGDASAVSALINDRKHVRAALTAAHPVLEITPEERLVVCCSRMEGDHGLTQLVRAWPIVRQQFRDARLWLIGDGRHAAQIWQLIVRLDLTASIVMPGYFDRLEDVMQAADLYVDPGGFAQAGEGMVHAMSCGLPAIAVRNPWTSKLIEPDTNGVLIPSTDARLMGQEICRNLATRERLSEMGRQARSTIHRTFSSAAQIDSYVSLLSNPSGQLAVTAK